MASSTITTLKKSFIYSTSPHKTPKLKDIIPASCSYDRAKDDTSIVMDEYGQTPDHYYLAKKTPTFYQAKRKLDLQIFETSKRESPQITDRKLRRNGQVVHKPINKRDKPRYDTSLGQLTKKFLKLLSDATDGVINLNTACALLAVPKRRLYDITNVLEGAGLIQKKSRNNIQWMGRASSPCSGVLKYDIEREIDILEAKENKLDELIYHMKCEINSFKDKNKKYQYITSSDLKSVGEFADKQLIGIPISPDHIIDSSENAVMVSNENAEIHAKLLCDVSYMSYNASEYTTFESRFINIENSSVIGMCPDELKSPKIFSDSEDSPIKVEGDVPDSPNIEAGLVWQEVLEGDPVIRNAFISEEDDIAPMGKHFLLQIEDQNFDELLPFPYLENPVESYSFSLDDGEGLTDLYDCGFQEISDGL